LTDFSEDQEFRDYVRRTVKAKVACEFIDDPDTPKAGIAFKLFLHFCKNDLMFFKPQPYKIWALADELKTRKEEVIKALSLLIDKGYVTEHERLQSSGKGIRQFMLTRNGSQNRPLKRVS
jgi:hypothetical protein